MHFILNELGLFFKLITFIENTSEDKGYSEKVKGEIQVVQIFKSWSLSIELCLTLHWSQVLKGYMVGLLKDL